MKKILFFLTFSLIYSKDVNTLKDEIKRITNEIKEKNTRIERINIERLNIQKQLKIIKKEIEDVQAEREKMEEELKVLNKNIQYGQVSLNYSKELLGKRKSEYLAKLISLNKKYSIENNTKNQNAIKRSFKNLLQKDLDTIAYIKRVQSSIEEVKRNIERDKRKVVVLKMRLDQNKLIIERKKAEKSDLIVRLNNEKMGHVKRITKLNVKKKTIEKEIERIIKARVIQKTNITIASAKKNLAHIQPIPGKIVVRFKEAKDEEVISNGIEIEGRIGSRVKAASEGKVIYADKFQGLNNVVMIDYGYNTIGVYGNLIGVGVQLNDRVEQGDDIGILGLNSEGKANLYYEVRFNLKPMNPEELFR